MEVVGRGPGNLRLVDSDELASHQGQSTSLRYPARAMRGVSFLDVSAGQWQSYGATIRKDKHPWTVSHAVLILTIVRNGEQRKGRINTLLLCCNDYSLGAFCVYTFKPRFARPFDGKIHGGGSRRLTPRSPRLLRLFYSDSRTDGSPFLGLKLES